MGDQYERAMLRDDRETEVEVTFNVLSWGCAAHMGSMSYAGHPAEGPEIEILKVETEAGEAVEPTQAEEERWITQFCEDPPEADDPADYIDWGDR